MADMIEMTADVRARVAKIAAQYGWTPKRGDKIAIVYGVGTVRHISRETWQCDKCRRSHGSLDVTLDTGAGVIGVAVCETVPLVETLYAYLTGRAEHLDAEIALGGPTYPANARWARQAAELRDAAAGLAGLSEVKAGRTDWTYAGPDRSEWTLMQFGHRWGGYWKLSDGTSKCAVGDMADEVLDKLITSWPGQFTIAVTAILSLNVMADARTALQSAIEEGEGTEES